MELRQLEAFAATLSTGSVTGAARLLDRSQPAISRSIQELEAQIGYALFTRSGPRVTPTTQGFLLYQDVERALGSLRHIRVRAGEIARGDGAPLRVAATFAMSSGLVPSALQRVAARHGAGHTQLRSMPAEQVVHAVLTGTAQLGVSSLPLEHRGVRVNWIGQSRCVVALPEEDPLAAHDVVPLAELGGRPLITLSNPYRLRRRLDAAMVRIGKDVAARGQGGLIETNSSINAMAAVRAGLGVSVMEPVTAFGAPMQGVVVRALDTDIPYFFGVITPQSQPLDEQLTVMVDALADAAAALLPGFVLHDAAAHASLLQSIYDGELAAEPESPQ
jgi:DNA-binding transcriptional LysR family regulator